MSDISEKNPNQNEPTYKLKLNIKCFKWLHNKKNTKYDEIFDYETRSFIMSEYTIKSKGTIVDNFKAFKCLDDVIVDKNEYSPDNQNEEGMTKEFLNQNIVVESLSNEGFSIWHNKYAYLVCKYYEESLRLQVDNIIKMGKYIFKVIIVKISNEVTFKNKICKQKLIQVESFEGTDKNQMHLKVNNLCRFCFKGPCVSNSDEDLYSVCNCKGTIQYVHLSCLSIWIKSRCKIDYEYINPSYFRIKVSHFYCEICHKNFPFVIKSSTGENIYLLEILKSKNNFLVLQNKLIKDENTIRDIKSSNNFREEIELIYLEFNTRKKQILFGREKNCDVVLDDISVSRRHCLIYLDDHMIRIKDLGSKFGTLVNMTESVILKYGKAVLQKGNSVYHISICT